MSKSAFKLLCLIASVVVGFAVSYAAMSFRVVAMSPIGLNLTRRDDPFARVFVEMARLREADAALRSCATSPGPSARQAILRVESELIVGLRTDSKSSGLTPPLDLAEAILELRSSRDLPKSATGSGGHEAATVTELIRRSGWAEDSEPALRQALTKMDGECK
jgi:hypothetical protein